MKQPRLPLVVQQQQQLLLVRQRIFTIRRKTMLNVDEEIASLRKNEAMIAEQPRSSIDNDFASKVIERNNGVLSDIETASVSKGLHHKSGTKTQDTRKLRVLTYNFYLRPDPIKENYSDFKKERLKIFMETQLDKYDVIAFQEVFTSYWQKQIIELAKHKGYHYSAAGPSSSFLSWPVRILDSGLLLISRYPIVDTNIMRFRNAATYDKLSNKGALHVRVAYGSESKAVSNVDFVVTHTQASYEDDSLEHPTTQARLKQVVELHKWMKQLFEKKGKKFPIVLLGDFNISSRPTRELCQRELPYDLLGRDEVERLPDDLFFKDQVHTEEYNIAFKSLRQGHGNQIHFKWRDLLFEKYGFHPPTYGAGNLERVLTDRTASSNNWSLDYIFYETNHDHTWSLTDPKTGKLDVRTVAFSIPESRKLVDKHIGQGLNQLSDHFGVELIMHYTKV